MVDPEKILKLAKLARRRSVSQMYKGSTWEGFSNLGLDYTPLRKALTAEALVELCERLIAAEAALEAQKDQA
jgi:hypothetical protein